MRFHRIAALLAIVLTVQVVQGFQFVRPASAAPKVQSDGAMTLAHAPPDLQQAVADAFQSDAYAFNAAGRGTGQPPLWAEKPGHGMPEFAPLTINPVVAGQQKLTASDAAVDDLFGYSVALSGDTAVVGAINDNTPAGSDAGSAYVFVRSGTTWTEQQKLTASDGAFGDFFGYSVALSGDTAVVGTRLDDTPAGTDAGSAYVFVRSGTTWTEQQKLTASDAAAEDIFGSSVAVDGDTAVVGADGNDTPAGTNAGSAYVFVRSGTTWTQQRRLRASDGAAGDFFGISVALDGDTSVVGADGDDTSAGAQAGSAYVFVRSGTTWTQQRRLRASRGADFDFFGNSVALSADTAVVGAAQGDTAGGRDTGSAYVFVRSGTTWTQQQKLTASDRAAFDRFGISVALSGEIAVVGAYFDDTGAGEDTGSAYVFFRSGTTWTQQQKLTASDGAAGDEFGISVALDGDTAVVGADRDNTPAGDDAGSAYVFELGILRGPPVIDSFTPPSGVVG
jgi:FG-GAP repeat